MKKKLIKIFLTVLSWSSNEKHKLGCFVVKDGALLSTGFNFDVGNRVIHAEVNALSDLSLAKIDGCTVYCSWSPCKCCEQYMRSRGVKTVYYAWEYPGNDAPDFCIKL